MSIYLKGKLIILPSLSHFKIMYNIHCIFSNFGHFWPMFTRKMVLRWWSCLFSVLSAVWILQNHMTLRWGMILFLCGTIFSFLWHSFFSCGTVFFLSCGTVFFSCGTVLILAASSVLDLQFLSTAKIWSGEKHFDWIYQFAWEL